MRRRVTSWTIAGLLACSPAVAEPPPLPWPDAAPRPATVTGRLADAVMRPVVVSLPGMERVHVVRDLRYRDAAEPQVRMDLYLPEAAGAPVPVVLFVHGGTDFRTQPKDWGIYQSWGRLAAASGIAGVTFTHRLRYPSTAIDQGADDVAQALAFVRANAAEHGMDPDRVCIVAYSAGGPMLAPYMVDAPSWLKCLVGWYPLMDIRQPDAHQPSEDAETLAAFSAVLKVAEPGPKTPLFLVRAGNDQIPTLRDSIDRFVDAALEADYPLMLANAPGAPHGFDNQTDDRRTREIVLASLRFLQGELGVRPIE